MSFEIIERDIQGRIGVLETKNGRLETPALLPVVNPLVQEISPRTMFEKYGCKALITNAYLVKRQTGSTGVADIHDFLDFHGVIATDSGAYQILRYGEVEISPSQIIEYQQSIQTDIGVILDVPTGSRASKKRAMETVNETIRRADEAQEVITRRDIRWVGPIQGGRYLDLVALSAREMSKRPFDIYALGSPTEIMEQYLFADLVDMIFAAKTNLPSNKAFHLFGAGHPFMLALAVALGCDLFDSAAYILYARRNRYLTQSGTLQLAHMHYFPCRCNACVRTNPDEVRSSLNAERIRFLAEHNLSICMQEIETIKEAVSEGKLWELVETRCRSHPSLLEGLRAARKHRSHMARGAPSTKTKGVFFFDSTSLQRPEHVIQLEQLLENYEPPREAKVALLVPAARQHLEDRDGKDRINSYQVERRIHVCLYSPPYGLVPSELMDTFPFSQTKTLKEPDPETLASMSETVRAYLSKNRGYEALVLVTSGRRWQTLFSQLCKRASKKIGVRFSTLVDQEILKKRIRILGRGDRYPSKAQRIRTLTK